MWQLRAGIIATSLILSSAALTEELKITVLYSQPKNAEEFDKYYYAKHMPKVYAVNQLKKVEIARPQRPQRVASSVLSCYGAVV